MVKPYIGVTGFMDRNEVETVLSRMPAEPNRQLMVGVLASWKTVRGIKNDWPNRYPDRFLIADIFSDDPRALNLVHYNTKEPETLRNQLNLVIERFAGKKLHGFQLNVCWPDPKEIERFYMTALTKFLVLQIGHRAFEAVGNSPRTLAQKIRHQYSMVEYVLLDPSGGTGKQMNPEVLRGYLQELYALQLPHTRFGVAGGLSPATMSILAPLAKEFPDLSIDAEGRLRDANDHLNVDVASEYVRQALNLFENNKTPQ